MKRRGVYLARRGFTLVELVVAVVIIGALAAISVVAVRPLQDRAMTAREQANLAAIATAVLADAALADAPELTRALVVSVLDEHFTGGVVDGLGASSPTWTLGGKDFVPTGPGQMSVAFTTDGGPASDAAGTHLVLVTSTGSTSVGRELDWDNRSQGAIGLEDTFPVRPAAEGIADNNPPVGDVTDPTPTPSPSPTPSPAPSGQGGWVGYQVSDGWQVDVSAPAYGETGPIVVTVSTPLTNQALTNERVRVEVSCLSQTQVARPVNSKRQGAKSQNVVLDREFNCDAGGGFGSLTISPSGRLQLAQGTYYAFGPR